MDYQQSIDYVTNTALYGAHKNGLDNIRELMDRLGNPQDKIRTVHVAGTNGKGSVCAYIAAILEDAGYRTGLYTSPYLERFTERFRVNGREIEPGDFARIATRVRSVAEAMTAQGKTHPTFFELVTAIGFLFFHESEVDVAVIETGVGGRLDATNIIRPIVSVITSIGRDHVKVLGNTIAEIAREKAGIIKQAVPVVVYPQPEPEAWAEIMAAAAGKQAPLYAVADSHIVTQQSSLGGQVFSISYQGLHLEELRIGLLGRYQVLNAATALIAVLVLKQSGEYALREENIRSGLAGARWPGRMEVMCRDPFVIIDGAHNPQSAGQLRRAVEDLFPGERVVLVCGILRTKEAGAMVRDLAAVASEVIVTQPDSQKAIEARELSALFESHRVPVSVAPRTEKAFEAGFDRARTTAQPLIIAGSLYLAGSARTWFINHLGTN